MAQIWTFQKLSNMMDKFLSYDSSNWNSCTGNFKAAVRDGFDINSTNNSGGFTLLHEACELNSYNFVKLLVDLGANVNCRDDDGIVPLHYAASIKIAKFLIKNNADMHAVDNNNNRNVLDHMSDGDSKPLEKFYREQGLTGKRDRINRLIQAETDKLK